VTKLINERRRDSTYNIVETTILYITTRRSHARAPPLELVSKEEKGGRITKGKGKGYEDIESSPKESKDSSGER
jgi:hypothetical protein